MNAPAHVAYNAIEAINWSSAVHLATSPRMFAWRREHPRPDTEALIRGTAIHCATLEPERFARDYIIEPDFDTRSNAGKAERAEWLATLAPGYIARPAFDGRTKAGREARAAFLAGLPPDARVLIGDEDAASVAGVHALPAEEYELVTRCAAAVHSHHEAAGLLRGGRVEEPLVWVDEETGLRCKGRLDFIRPDLILDLKSTRHTTIHAMARDCAARLYHGQLAFYHDGAIASRRIPADAPTPRIILVQTTEPYDVVVARLAPEDLERGRGLCRSLLRRYAECQAADWWPGLAPSLIDLPLPAWAPGGDAPTEEEDW